MPGSGIDQLSLHHQFEFDCKTCIKLLKFEANGL